MRARIINVYQALMWACCLFSLAYATDPLTSSFWEPVTTDMVVISNVTPSPLAGGYLRAKRTRSKVECVSECNSHPDCFSVAFDSTSGDCHLQPDLSNDPTQPAHLGQVWVKEGDAPVSNGIVDWDHTLTSPRGTVTCNEEFMKTTDDVSVTCMAGGSWLREGGCVRHIWTNPSLSIFPLDVPVPVVDGWTVCVDGIPTKATRFTVNLIAGPGNLALHAQFRKKWGHFINILVTDTLMNGRWGGGGSAQTRLDPFPVSVDTPFRIKVKATSSNTFEIYVNDKLTVTNSQNPGVPASDVTEVELQNDVNVTRVDLWCHN